MTWWRHRTIKTQIKVAVVLTKVGSAFSHVAARLLNRAQRRMERAGMLGSDGP